MAAMSADRLCLNLLRWRFVPSASGIALQPLRPRTCHLVLQTADDTGFMIHMSIACRHDQMQIYLPQHLAFTFTEAAQVA